MISSLSKSFFPKTSVFLLCSVAGSVVRFFHARYSM